MGAREASKRLRVSLASFYNYCNGTDLPKMEVLRDAQVMWDIEWEMIDPAKILKSRSVANAEQLLLPFIRSVREEDIKILEVAPAGDSSLRVILRIQFGTESRVLAAKRRA